MRAPLEMRAHLGRKDFGIPSQFGPGGWLYRTHAGHERPRSVLVSSGFFEDREWLHASVATPAGTDLPTYADLTLLHHAVFGIGWAYQVFAAPSWHVNIHPNALHLWGLDSGEAALPNFAENGSI